MAYLGQPQDKEIYSSGCQILKVYVEILPGLNHMLNPDGLNTAFLFQGCNFGAACGWKESKWDAHSKDRGGGEKPPIAQVGSCISWWLCLLEDIH